MIYAGFWKRALAFLIDGIILAIPIAVFAFLVMGSQYTSMISFMGSGAASSPEMFLPLMSKWLLSIAAIWVFNIVVIWLYHAFMESASCQATFGKMILGIKVVGAHGERISFARATGRTFGKFISHLLLYFGDYMAGFTEHRQALHDLMASTYVVNKDYQEGQELVALPFSVGGLIAGILAAVGPIILQVVLIVLTMVMGVSDMKNNSDMQKMWDDLKTEDGAPQNEQLSKILNDMQREVMLSSAQVEMINLRNANTTLTKPVEKEDIIYSQTPEGYKASFKDPNGDEYELLQRTGEILACCLKGPGGKCTDNAELYQPCK